MKQNSQIALYFLVVIVLMLANCKPKNELETTCLSKNDYLTYCLLKEFMEHFDTLKGSHAFTLEKVTVNDSVIYYAQVETNPKNILSDSLIYYFFIGKDIVFSDFKFSKNSKKEKFLEVLESVFPLEFKKYIVDNTPPPIPKWHSAILYIIFFKDSLCKQYHFVGIEPFLNKRYGINPDSVYRFYKDE